MRAVPLIVAPTHSKETRLLATAAVHLHRWFLSQGFKSNILLGFGARKAPLMAMLNSLRGQPIAMFYYGHGTKKTLLGSEFITRKMPPFHMLTKKRDPWNNRIISLLRGALIFTVACDSADDLGNYLVSRGIRSFVGSKEPMWITQNLDFDKDGTPDMTGLFTLAPRQLAQGMVLDQAVENYKNRALEMRANYVFNTKYPEVGGLMEKNIRNYGIIGDQGWTWYDQQ